MKCTLVFLMVMVMLALSGCAAYGPMFTSSAVYGSSRDAIVAGNRSVEAYYKVQTESYRAGNGGNVQQVGTRPRTPGYYMVGILVNRRPNPVTFHIKGEKSIDIEVNARAQVELPAGRYWVELYEAQDSWPYRSGVVVIDTERGDTVVNDRVYDFSITAH